MRRSLSVSVFGVLLAALGGPAAARAQQAPAFGCSASPSCRQSGFSILTGQDREHTAVLFDLKWEPTFRVDLARREGPPTGTIAPQEGRFHLQPPGRTPA